VEWKAENDGTTAEFRRSALTELMELEAKGREDINAIIKEKFKSGSWS
jgi:hypothetical protein